MMLKDQYNSAVNSRRLLLNYLAGPFKPGLDATIPGLNDKTIRDILVHVASSYFYWIGYFALARSNKNPEAHDYKDIDEIRSLYHEVDSMMDIFFERYADSISTEIPDPPEEWGKNSATPLQAFTQVFTHEYHHKGQIVMICRLLGFEPPDTDARRSFPGER